MPSASWLAIIDVGFLERRFGPDSISSALSAPRVYAVAPSMDGGRLVASVVEAPGGKRLTTPVRVSVRLREDDVLDVSCACRKGRVCDHVMWALVDVALCPALRAALSAGGDTETTVKELAVLRARALEDRTLDERLATWLPPRRFDDDLELDVDAITIAGAVNVTSEGRAAILLRHRRRAVRRLVGAREVLAARLPRNHRRLVELTAPYHLDRDALVATRGQASLLVHLLREEMGIYAHGFKARVRFARDPVTPRVEPDGDRLRVRWYSSRDDLVGDAAETLLFAGPFPYLWSPGTFTFHEVAASVDLDAAMGMHRVPSLPIGAAVAARVGRALLTRGRGLGVALPPPEVFGLPSLEKPSFELRLTGSPLDVQGELFAIYAFGKVRVEIEGDSSRPRAPTDVRDLEAEDVALALLREAGFAEHSSGLVAREEQAVLLWEHGLAKLRACSSPRFDLLVSEPLAKTKIAPPATVDVRVSASAGWLDVELDFRSGALKIELARMHQALATGKRWVVLSDGTLAKIADEVASFVGELGGLEAAAGATSGRVALPLHQLGRVARWTDVSDEDGWLFVDIDPRVEAIRARLRDVARLSARVPSQLTATLRPYQRIGLGWLQLLRELGVGGLLADDMGLGKTLVTLAFVARWKEDESPAGVVPSLVVCPTSLVGNWLREAQRFTPDLRAIAWTGPDRRSVALERYDLVITTYGVLRRAAEQLARERFRCVVLDEAQNVKNPQADTSRLSLTLQAEMRVALTGTPVENRLTELWSLMSFANPGLLGSLRDFEAKYERPITTRPDGQVAGELRALVRPFILRRTKSEVLVDLPPKTELERSCIFGLRQKRLYDALALALRQALARTTERREGARTQLSVLTAILRLRQMACDPRLVDPEVSAADSAKRAVFLGLVRELVAEGRRALVFSQFVELLHLWREDLDRSKVAYEYLDGSTRDRDAVVQRFQTGGAPLMLVSLKAGGAGLNLTAADTVIHCDPWWNPAAEDQATDRAHRIGQSRPVTVVRLVAQGTIEDKIALLKRKKEELVEAILGGDASALGGLSEGEISVLLGDAEVSTDEDTPC